LILSLSAENFGIFGELHVEFSKGLNVITGSSGAGKSMLLELILLLCGAKASVPVFKERAYAEMLLDTGKEEPLIVSLRSLRGRLNYRLNGESVPRTTVYNMLEELIEIHKQGVTWTLTRRNVQSSFIDRLVPEELLKEYSKIYREYKKYRDILNSIEDTNELEVRRDYLKSETKRLKELLENIEDEERFMDEVKTLENAEMIRENAQQLKGILEREKENLVEAFGIAENMERLGIRTFKEMIQDILETANELIRMADEKMIEMDTMDENALEHFRKLSELLRWAKYKYGPALEEIRKNYSIMEKEIQEIDERLKLVERARNEIVGARMRLKEVGEKLESLRADAAEQIESKVKEHLKELGMKGAEIEFIFTERDEPGVHGLKDVVLKVRTIENTPFAPIEKVASGGELSRIYLALNLATHTRNKILIFDEVESGLGQRYANVLARFMKRLAHDNQVILITHLPEMAMAAENHIVVRKEGSHARVEKVEDEEKIHELVQMYGGSVSHEVVRKEYRKWKDIK